MVTEGLIMKLIRTAVVVSAFVALGGCVAVPVGPGYYGGPPAYYGSPGYYGPAIGVRVYGGRGYGHRHRRH
jgi:hypothetical protein